MTYILDEGKEIYNRFTWNPAIPAAAGKGALPAEK